MITIDAALFKAKLKKLGDAVNKDRLFNAVGMRGIKWVNDNFKREGLEIKWKPLSPNTVANRRKGSSAILQDTGRLRQSFDYKLTPDAVIVGTQSKIASYHNDGTKPYNIKAKKKTLAFNVVGGRVFPKEVRHPGLPARPLIPSPKEGESIAVTEINAIIDKATNG